MRRGAWHVWSIYVLGVEAASSRQREGAHRIRPGPSPACLTVLTPMMIAAASENIERRKTVFVPFPI
ncbi:hypothetical protein BRADI_1g04015v3 [Brachypodium distachyon]|uniref:Secreted protein n=1 Tax=Brachypodium distachyon TaxID=15368 RepID=A0A2K2DI02_BRADI|nr:hypothetical protein BRADI_1g04015v3 [Brachypodium distachyon]